MQAWDHEFDCQEPRSMLGMMVPTCNLSTGEVESRESCASLASQHSWTSELWANKKHYHKTMKHTPNKVDSTQGCLPYVHTYPCIYTCTHIQINTLILFKFLFSCSFVNLSRILTHQDCWRLKKKQLCWVLVHASCGATAFGGCQENVHSSSGLPPSLQGLQVCWNHRVCTAVFYSTASVKVLRGKGECLILTHFMVINR